MKDQKKTEIRVGVTVIISLLLFLYIFGWAKNFNAFSDEKELTIKFNTVAGLDKGDRVMVNGMRMGFVDEVYSQGTKVLVNVTLDPKVDLREDASFQIMMLDLMGGKIIEINPGMSEVPIDYSIVQEGNFSGDISTAMAALGSVQKDLVEVIKDVRVTFNAVNELLGDNELKNNLKSSVSNLNKLSVKLNSVIDENKDGLKKLIESSNNAANAANKLINDNSDELNKVLKNFNELSVNANQLIQKIDELTEETKSQKNNVGKLLYDPDFAEQLKQTLQQTNELIKIILEQLKSDGINVDANIF